MLWLWKRLTLLQRFTLASATIAVALGLVLVTATIQAIESFAVKDEAQVAAELVLRAVGTQLRPADLGGPLPPDRRDLLDALFRAHGISDRALRIRLWRADGQLLYTNAPDDSVEGRTRPDMSGVDLSTESGYAALLANRGQVERTAPSVVRFFVPAVVEGDPKPLAAFEIFYDLTHLEQQLAFIRRTIWTAVPAGFFLLYASVFVLVRRASRRLLEQQAQLIAAHLGTYEALASAIDAKDSYTGDHSTKVADLAAALAGEMGLSAEVAQEMRMGARLHDLGKIGVPDAILAKPGRLTPEEMAVMREHAERGFEIVRKAPLSTRAKLAVRHNHERWDGTGYPSGLAGEAIPISARIVAVVDAFEAMTSNRPYRKAMPVEDALKELQAGAGSQFDPQVVRALVRLIRRSRKS